MHWSSQRFNLDPDDALDVFQDTIIAFYKNVRDNKVDRINYSLKTYLYAIGKHIILSRLKSKQMNWTSTDDLEAIAVENEIEKWEISNEAKSFVEECLDRLGEPCHQILRLFYYEGYSLEAIANAINAKNANVVKAQKSRCMQKLTKLIKAKFKPEDLL